MTLRTRRLVVVVVAAAATGLLLASLAAGLWRLSNDRTPTPPTTVEQRVTTTVG